MTKRKAKPKTKLTEKERQLRDVIKKFIRDNGYSPSHEEIGDRMVEPINKVTVATHLQHMQEKGVVDWKKHSPRTVRIL